MEDTVAVNKVVEVFGAVIRGVRERIDATGAADATPQDLLIGLATELKKQSWMFQAENQA